MGRFEIRDVGLEELDHLINLCIPPGRKDDPLFVEGMKEKRRWATRLIERYGSIAKLAYLDSKPVGLIQYQPIPEERLVEITCIFVPEEENLRKGIGRALLKALMGEMNEAKPFFDNKPPLAFVTWAFQVPGRYPQHEFYRRMGFKRVREEDPFFLYYPLEEGYVHRPKRGGVHPPRGG